MAVLLEELKEVDNWFMLGAYLNVPVSQLNKIQSTHSTHRMGWRGVNLKCCRTVVSQFLNYAHNSQLRTQFNYSIRNYVGGTA